MSIIGRTMRSLATWSDEDDRWYAHPFTITGNPGLAGRTVTKETALTFSVVYACIKILSDSIASLPLHMYMRLSNGGRVRATERQIYRILSRSVNPEMSTYRWKSVMQAHLAAWGNHFSYVQRTDDGRVVSLWPLNPDLVTVRRNERTTELEYEFRHPKIPRVFNRSQVFHIPGFGYNGLVGKSPITLAREAIGLGLAAEEFGARFYGDGTHPGMVAMHPHKLDAESHENLKKSLTTAVGGLGKAHRLLLLEEGMKIENISIPPEEAQFLATRKFQVQEICRFFNMKPHMVADLDRATFSNIEHQGIEFVVHTLGPWLSLIEAELAHYFLLPEERRDFYFEFMVEKFLRGDIKARYEAYQIARNVGWMNADEIREKENMMPMPDGLGKVYTVQAGVQSLSFLSENPSGKLPEPIKEKPKEGEEPITAKEAENFLIALKVEVNGLLATTNDKHFALFREMWEYFQQSAGKQPEASFLFMQGLKSDIEAIRDDIKENGFDEEKMLQRDNELSKKVDKAFKSMEEKRVKREGELLAAFQARREEERRTGDEIRDVIAKVVGDNKEISKEIKDLSEQIIEMKVDSTVSDGEARSHINSLGESLLEQIINITEKQSKNEGMLGSAITEIKEMVQEGRAIAGESLTTVLKKIEVFKDVDSKDKVIISKEFKQFSGKIEEIRADRALSDGEKKLQIEALQDEMVRLISEISKEQKGYAEAIAQLQKAIGNSNVDMDALISGVGGMFIKELAKLNKEQEKRTSKLLADVAEEKRLQEERTGVMISKLEDMIGEARREVAELRNNQDDSEAMHSDEMARLEGTITMLESRHNSLSSGRSVANKDKVVSQYTPIIQDAVQMILNRESIAVKRVVKKFATNKDKLIEWLEDFYRGLPEFMHLKLDRILHSFIEAMQVEVMIERGVPEGDIPSELSILIHEYTRDYIKKHVEFSLDRLKRVAGNENPLAIEVVIDEWYENRAMQATVEETNEVCRRVEQFVTERGTGEE